MFGRQVYSDGISKKPEIFLSAVKYLSIIMEGVSSVHIPNHITSIEGLRTSKTGVSLVTVV